MTAASAIAISISQLPNAAVAQPVERDRSTVEVAGSTPARRFACPSARGAVSHYLRRAWHFQRLSFQPRLEIVTSGRSCRQARAAAVRFRLEARRARLVYLLWVATPKLSGETPWHASSASPVNRNLLLLARCETGYLDGGRVNWRHHNAIYSGGLGFAHSTWAYYRQRVRPLPPAIAAHATVAEQLAVGRALVRIWPNYSSWPACSRRLGLR